jgi:hypothetical protein
MYLGAEKRVCKRRDILLDVVLHVFSQSDEYATEHKRFGEGIYDFGRVGFRKKSESFLLSS